MLVEEGFSVTSVDASDKMLKYALKERWNRRREPAFDKWGKSIQRAPQACTFRVTLFALALSCGRAGWFSSGHGAVPVIFLKRKALASE